MNRTIRVSGTSAGKDNGLPGKSAWGESNGTVTISSSYAQFGGGLLVRLWKFDMWLAEYGLLRELLRQHLLIL